MSVVVHGIANCDTVKKARTWLDEQGLAYTFHDFKKAGVTAELIKGWLQDVPLDSLLNRRGTTWRALPDASKAAAETEAGAIAVMLEKPSVIKRPVVVVNGHVKAVGFNADQYRTLL
jgi:arsenate reductase